MIDRPRWSLSSYQLLAIGIAILAGIVIFVIASEVFPYHSSNHDEGVYLQQAAMLLDGRLYLTPGSPELREAVHPWFFVESDAGFYPKYNPVPAGMFAVGLLLGEPRVILGAIAVIIALLTYGIISDTFGPRTGLLAEVLLITSPLFLLPTAAFLPYAPTTALNLVFIFAYIRAVRQQSQPYAALAGTAIGLAFFARPYTALLVALPFIVYSGYRFINQPRHTLSTQGIIGLIGFGFVGLTLGYNAILTGNPLVFPYEAFAPHDGLGFGHRQILGHETTYTPGLAIEATGIILTELTTQWYTAPPLGILLAVAGIGLTLYRHTQSKEPRQAALPDQTAHLLFLSILLTVIVGNLYFWGNLNILGDITDPTDGVITIFGPFYHYDLLFPLSAFAAYTLVTTYDFLTQRHPLARLTTQPVSGPLVIIVCLVLIGGLTASALGSPIDKNASYTEKYDEAYTPFEQTEFEHALVFLPTPYGEWMNHPFQYLRNAPTFDGPVVYAISRTPSSDFAVLDAYPDRTVYRYRYHGEWTPDPNNHVIPQLEQTQRVSGSTITAETTVTIPDRITHISVSLAYQDTTHRYQYADTISSRLTIPWQITPDEATLDATNLRPSSNEPPGPVPIDGPGEVSLTITITEPGGGALTYREDLLVQPTEQGIEVIWPPASSVCLLVTDCGLEGTYLPDQPATRPAGINMTTTLETPT